MTDTTDTTDPETVPAVTDPEATEPAGAPQISSKARSHLRSLAHALDPVVQIGAEGLTEPLLAATREALREHELIKVKVGKTYAGDRKQAARDLAEAVEADLTQVIGRVVVLYRPRPPAKGEGKGKGKGKGAPGDAKPRIVLPG